MKTVMVMGLRGKTGRRVAAALLRLEGVAVRGGTRMTSSDVPGITLCRFEWEDSGTWAGALAGVEAVYLIKPKTVDPAATVASFLRSAGNLQRIVLLSEIDAGNRDEATDERRVERVVESSPIAWTILRPNWFMQNFTEPSFYLEDIREAGEIIVPSGGQATSFVDTRDIADVAVAALLDSGHAGQVYTLTGPRALTWAEVTELIGEAAGHEVRHVDPPLDDYLGTLSSRGVAKPTIEYYKRIYGSIEQGRTSIVSTDVERVTGHPPRAFAAFVEENNNRWRWPSSPS